MAYCPNCGGQIDGGTASCPHCGAASGASERPGSGEWNGGSRPDRESTRSEAPSPGGRRDDAGRQPQPAPTQQGRPADGNGGGGGGFGRRRLLAAGAGLVGLGGTGWYLFLRDDSPDSPLGVAERSWSTWADSDATAYQELFHSDSPERQQEYWNDVEYWAQFGPGEEVDWTIEEREVVERTAAEATVREVYRWETPDETVRITETIELRREGDDWKIWQFQESDVEPVS